MIKLSQPTEADIQYVAANLRTADIAECDAAGSTPLHSLRVGLEQGHHCYTLSVGIEPIGMCGSFNSEELETCYIWFIGTDRSVDKDIAPYWFHFAPTVIEKMRDGLRYTSCLSVASNTKHHDWLKAIGYEANYDAKPGHVILTKEHF